MIPLYFSCSINIVKKTFSKNLQLSGLFKFLKIIITINSYYIILIHAYIHVLTKLHANKLDLYTLLISCTLMFKLKSPYFHVKWGSLFNVDKLLTHLCKHDLISDPFFKRIHLHLSCICPFKPNSVFLTFFSSISINFCNSK